MDRVLSCVYNHRSSKNATNIEDLCVADGDIIAHFDNIPSLLYLAYVKKNMGINEGKDFVRNKLERSYNKLSKRSKEFYKDKYKNVMENLL